jgi:hypothetical protein
MPLKRRNPFIQFKLLSSPARDCSDVVRLVREIRALQVARATLPLKREQRYGSVIGSAQATLAEGIRNNRELLRSRQRPNVQTVMISYSRRGITVETQIGRNQIATVLRTVRNEISRRRQQARLLESTGATYVPRLGRSLPTYDHVHIEAGTFLKLSKAMKARRVRSDKRPQTADRHVGLELEFCSPVDADTLGAMLTEANLADHVQLKGDGSVNANAGDHAHEICILATQSTVSEIVPKVTAVLAQARSYVNASCGYHVHLDMRDRDSRAAWTNLRQCQPLLYKMAPKTRKTGRYCKPVRTKDFGSARRSGNRYVGINAQALSEHRTIEVRLHSSTLDPRKILNWVDLLVRIIDAAPIEKPVNSPLAIRRTLDLPMALASYVKARVELFAAQHAGDESTETADAA